MTNQLIIGLGVFFLLGVLLILSNLNQQKNKSSYDNIFQHDVSHIAKIIIQSGDDAIEIARLDTTWKISGNDSLIIKEAFADGGPFLKRFRAASMGRISKLNKPTSHLTIVVSDE